MLEGAIARESLPGRLAFALAAAGTVLAIRFDAFERFYAFARAYDAWQIDELLIAATLFATAGFVAAYDRERRLRKHLELIALAKDEAVHAARRDHLTGLPNRLALEEAYARADGRTAALALIDLDGFKEVNDTFGHDAGDKLLVEVGRRINQVAMASGASIVARLGGDEFACLLLADRPADTDRLSRDIIAAISQPVALGDQEARVTPSIGIAPTDSGGSRLDEMLCRADAAMYSAKRGGGAWACTFRREVA